MIITLLKLAKRLTEKQKKEIIESFKKGAVVSFLSEKFSCSKLTITRILKINLGEVSYKKLIKTNKLNNKFKIVEKGEINNDSNSDISDNYSLKMRNSNKNSMEDDIYPVSPFLEISPIDYEIDHSSRKEVSSVPIAEIEFPEIVYMIVDKKIELETKLLGDYPEWEFLPDDDLNRKTIEVFYDIKVAKRLCNKEQKVIKIPNTDVFKIAATSLLSKGISRIISADKLIAL